MATSPGRRRILSIAFLTVVAGAVTASVWFHVSSAIDRFGECRTVVLSSILSPSLTKSIVISRKECGATVSHATTQVSIAPADRIAFSIERNPAFFSISGSSEVLAKWLGEKTVEIALIPGGGEIHKNEKVVDDITIEYR